MNVAIINCFDTYEQRVDLVYNFFINRGDIVRIYASDYKHIEKVYLKDKKKDYVYINVVPYKKNISVKRLYSHYRFSKDVFDRLDRQNLDLIWLLVPPNSLVKQAAILKKKKPSIKIIADIIDMWPETIPIRWVKNNPTLELWKIIRNRYISQADYIITECDLYKKELMKINVANKIKTVYLAREVKEFNYVNRLSDSVVSLCYLGSINNIIDINSIGKLIKIISKSKSVVLHIIGDGERRNMLIDEAEVSGAKVLYYGIIYDKSVKKKIFEQCHFGLNFMKQEVFVGLTMKSIDYFEAGLPIINNIHGDTWNIVKDRFCGLNFDSNFSYLYKNEFRVNSRDFFEECLSVDSFEREVNKVIQKIM